MIPCLCFFLLVCVKMFSENNIIGKDALSKLNDEPISEIYSK